MDYKLDAEEFRERGFAIIVTAWVNLGAGLDRADVKWDSHMALPAAGRVNNLHHQGEIQINFEEHVKLRVDELIADNKLRLFSKR